MVRSARAREYHPSGDPTPSAEDQAFTERMNAACDIVGVRLVDHLILGAARRWTVSVDAGDPELRITLAWDDVPASVMRSNGTGACVSVG